MKLGNVPDLLFSKKPLINLNKIKAFENRECRKREVVLYQICKKTV